MLKLSRHSLAKRLVMAIGLLLILAGAIQFGLLRADWVSKLEEATQRAERIEIIPAPTPARLGLPPVSLRGRQQVEELISTIDIDRSRSGYFHETLGTCWIEFYGSDNRLLVTLIVIGGGHLRWTEGKWSGDATLTPQAENKLAKWLSRHNCPCLNE